MYMWRDSWKNHLKIHTNEKTYTCDECNASFRWKGNMRRHIEKRHESIDDDLIKEEDEVVIEKEEII